MILTVVIKNVFFLVKTYLLEILKKKNTYPFFFLVGSCHFTML